MVDFNKLKIIYRIGGDLSLNDVLIVLQLSKRKLFAPGDYLIESGSKNKNIFFIRKGLVRSFAVTEKGEEVTVDLHWENQFTMNYDSILFDRPSQYAYQAIESTEVFFMRRDSLQSIMEKHPKLEYNRKLVHQEMLRKFVDRVHDFVLFSPEKRYLRFLETYPDLVCRVPDKYIANFLGITPVSLSRIRQRVVAREK